MLFKQCLIYSKEICRDFPEENEELPILKEKSFTNRKAEGFCEFEPVISRKTNETLRHYSIPPCKTTFKCDNQDESVVNLIRCKLDGTFDRKAMCSNKPVNFLLFQDLYSTKSLYFIFLRIQIQLEHFSTNDFYTRSIAIYETLI